MAIILKNMLNKDVHYATKPSVGSGIIKAGGDAKSISGEAEVYWNIEKRTGAPGTQPFFFSKKQ